jgi:hypothetical protein
LTVQLYCGRRYDARARGGNIRALSTLAHALSCPRDRLAPSRFLAAGAGAFLCTIGGERVLLRNAGDAAKADAAARRVKRPQARAAASIPGAG